MDLKDFQRAIARISDVQGDVRGCGVLLGRDLVVTAAFTVPEDVDEALVDFPFAGAGPITARVVFRAQPESQAFGDSLAALRIDPAQLPEPITPVSLAESVSPGLEFRAFGFPRGYGEGVWIAGRTLGIQPSGLVQLESGSQGFEPGFGGTPVWSDDLQAVIGLVLTIGGGKSSTSAWANTRATMLSLWPELASHLEAGPPPPTAIPEPQGPPVQREQTRWVSDSPAERDLLKREALASVLAGQLRHARAEHPDTSFLLHVDGAWGTGKSTLLKLLAADLGTDSTIVEFNAWRHMRVDPPWWALLVTVRSEVAGCRPRWRRPFFRLRETFARVRRDGATQLLSALLLAAAAGVAALLFSSSAGLEAALKTVSSIAGAVGGLWAVGVLVSRYVMWDSARRARSFEQSHTNPMNDVAEHFAWLVGCCERPIVVFVEDLDRCDAAHVVGFLDSIQTLMRDVKRAPSFVVAMDGAWLRRAYEHSYETFATAVAEPGRPLGYLFLDKLFQLTVPMPKLGAVTRDEYFGALLGLGSASERPAEYAEAAAEVAGSANEVQVLDSLSRASGRVREMVAAIAVRRINDTHVQHITHHALSKFAGLLHNNPRAMKRYVNTYTVLRAVRTLEGSVVPTDALALWTVVRIRWPELADFLESHPEAVEDLDKRLPEPLRDLGASADVQAVLRGVNGVRLTPDIIRACSGAGNDMSPAPA